MSIYVKHILYDVYGIVLEHHYDNDTGRDRCKIRWMNRSPSPIQTYSAWDIKLVSKEEYLTGLVLGS